MFYIGEPLLKPFVLALALIYVALVSQPLWATEGKLNTGVVANNPCLAAEISNVFAEMPAS